MRTTKIGKRLAVRQTNDGVVGAFRLDINYGNGEGQTEFLSPSDVDALVAVLRPAQPVAEGASLAALQQRIVELEQDRHSTADAVGEHASIAALLADRDEMTVYLKVEALLNQWEAAEQRLAEVTRERDDLDKDYGVLLKESTAELRKAKDEAEENWQSVTAPSA